MTEIEIAFLLCTLLSGAEVEKPARFENGGVNRHIRIDCETDSHVIEVGLDGKSGSRDSVHQAVFAGLLTGKRPLVVLIDRDGVEGRYEQEMRAVTGALGIDYAVCSLDAIARWRITAPFRAAWRTGDDDLPPPSIARTRCDLADIYLRGLALQGIAPESEKLDAVIGN